MEWVSGFAWGVVWGMICGFVVGYGVGYVMALRDNKSAIRYYRDDAMRRYAAQTGRRIIGSPEPPPL